ncbi:MAG: hypothetical protein IPL65_12660 [Lewinellaceae bacterium]|nr:hypothetical protein [Lewinellaceae bacterium]
MPFTTACQWLAADANRSGSVTLFDLLELRKLILGIYSELPSNTSWRFIYTPDNQPLPPYPFGAPLQEMAEITYTGMDTTLHFRAVKIGDLNCSTIGGVPPGLGSEQYLLLRDQALVAGTELVIPVRAAQSVQWAGYQFSMEFDPEVMQLLDIVPGAGMSAENFAVMDAGRLSVSWSDALETGLEAGAQMFGVKVRVLKNSGIQPAVRLQPAALDPEAYSLPGERHALKLLYGQMPFNTKEAEVFAPFPNPGSGECRWVVVLPEAMPLFIRLSDVQGRVVLERNFALQAGWNEIALPSEVLQGTQLYFWRIVLPEQAGQARFEGRLVRD